MKKRIVVEYGKISQISKDFKVTRQAVYKALNYLSNSSKATLIRKVAIERGGVEIGDQKETGLKPYGVRQTNMVFRELLS